MPESNECARPQERIRRLERALQRAKNRAVQAETLLAIEKEYVADVAAANRALRAALCAPLNWRARITGLPDIDSRIHDAKTEELRKRRDWARKEAYRIRAEADAKGREDA